MEFSSEYLDENIIKQISTIEENKSNSSEILKLLRIEDLRISEYNESKSKKQEMFQNNFYNLSSFAESLSQIRSSLSLINSEIETKKCQNLSFDTRLNRIFDTLERTGRKTDDLNQVCASLELRLKDYSSANDFFLNFFEGITEDADIRIQELQEKHKKLEEKVEVQANPEKRVYPRKSKDDEKLILTIKSPKSRSNKLN
jgi:hypothetical protein